MSPRPRGVRRLLRVALAVLALVVVGVAAATPASAHAELEGTTPAGGAVLASAPNRVTLSFSEDVSIPPGAVRVLDAQLRRVDRATARHVGGDRSTVELALPGLGDGLYVVSWHVVSDDSHPIRGAFTFRVGGASGDGADALAARVLSEQGSPPAVHALAGTARALGFAALFVLFGGALLATAAAGVGPTGRTVRAWRTLIVAAGAVAAVAGLAGLLAQGPLVTGRSLGALTDGDLLRDTLGDKFGRLLLARTVLAVALAAVLTAGLRPSDRRRSPLERAVPVAVAVLAALCLALSGHASTGSLTALAVPADAAHVLAGGAWVGGLAFLALALLARPTNAAAPDAAPDAEHDGHEAALIALVRRFSGLALVLVVVVAATGAFQGVRQVRPFASLTSTEYGKLLLAKVAAVAVVAAIGGLSRRLLAQHRATAVTLRPRVLAEVAGSIAIVVLTALLVNQPPAKTAYAKPVSVSARAGTLLVDVTVDPAKAGPNTLHLYTLSAAGAVQKVEDVTATLSLPGSGVEKLPVPLVRAGPGHFIAQRFDIPVKGTWRLDLSVLVDDTTAETATAVVRVR